MRRRRDPRPQLPTTGVLDWSSGAHWSDLQRACRYCQQLTNLRDSAFKPAHKVCAEEALLQQIADAAAAYKNERLA